MFENLNTANVQDAATVVVADAAYDVRHAEILASRAAGERLSYRQASTVAQYPDVAQAARHYNNVRRALRDLFPHWEAEHASCIAGANRAETLLGEPLTTAAP